MARNICISFTDWFYDTWLATYSGNRSRFIETVAIKGIQVETGELNSMNQKILGLVNENRNLTNELKRIKAELERAKKRSSHEMSDQVKMSKALLQAGILR